MSTKPLIAPLILSLTISACSPTRHEMPITTSSEEARELFDQAVEIKELGVADRSDSLFYRAIELDSNFAMAHARLYRGKGLEKAVELMGHPDDGKY